MMFIMTLIGLVLIMTGLGLLFTHVRSPRALYFDSKGLLKIKKVTVKNGAIHIKNGGLLRKGQGQAFDVSKTEPILFKVLGFTVPAWIVTFDNPNPVNVTKEGFKSSFINSQNLQRIIDNTLVSQLLTQEELQKKLFKYILFIVLAIVAIVFLFLVFGGTAHVETTCKVVQPAAQNITRVLR